LDENKWQVEVALAGYDKKDIEVRVIEGTLVVSTVNKDTKVDDTELVHRGISQRQFTRTWSMADDSVVQRAKMEDGMLYVEIERIVPEEKKPKIIEIK
jgi:molecular chaperone IbpA